MRCCSRPFEKPAPQEQGSSGSDLFGLSREPARRRGSPGVRLCPSLRGMAKVPESLEEVKTMECVERQVELDAIALYGNSHEFPPLAGSFVTQEPGEAEPQPLATPTTD